MAVKNRVSLTKGKPGANDNDLETSVSAMLLNGIAVANKLVLGTVYTLTNLAGCVDLGLNAAYDAANSVLVYYHIKEFYRMAGDGTVLNLMVVAKGVLPSTLLTDSNLLYAKKLILGSDKKVRQLAVAFNPVTAPEARAVATLTLNTLGVNGDRFDVIVDQGGSSAFGTTVIASIQKSANESSTALMCIAVIGNVAAQSANNGHFTASCNGNVITVYAPVGAGSTINGINVTLIKVAADNSFITEDTQSFAAGVSAYTETVTDGFNTDIRAAIQPAQAFAQWAYDNGAPCHVLLEGRKYGGNSGSAIDLRNIQVSSATLQADKVSLVIGQDYDFAEGLGWALGKLHAAVGNALGSLASVAMEQNIGEVETMDITDVNTLNFVTGGLSNHTKITEAATDAQLDTLDDKGYIFPIKYGNISGLRWNDDHVCTPIIIDADGNMNEHTISYGRTVNEAVRKLYNALVPKIKSTHEVDATTGKLMPVKIKYFEGLGNEVFNGMQRKGNITLGNTIVDPNSDLFHPPKQLNASFTIVPKGTVGKISGTVNLKTNL